MVPSPLLLGLVLTAIPPEGEAIQARYDLNLIGQARALFVLPPGPRTIQAFRWVPDPGSSLAWRSARIRLVWDGDDPDSAGVDLPLGLFVTSESENGPPLDGFVNRRRMPYRRTGRLIIDAEGQVAGSILLETVPASPDPGDQGYLRAQLRRLPVPPETPNLPDSANPGNAVEPEAPAVRYWYDLKPGPASNDSRE